jgi:hypothetical protein
VYLWFVLKNVLGWLLILGSLIVGPLPSGPIGFPMFIIGFALVTFPGKRRITARVLSGKPVSRNSRPFQHIVAVAAVVLPAVAISILTAKGILPSRDTTLRGLQIAALYVVSSLCLWWLGLNSLFLVNRLLGVVPRVRRKFRPWLRRYGIDLLPRRRRGRSATPGGPVTHDPDPEILEIHERHLTRASHAWEVSRPWVKRALGLAITAGIFIWIFEPAAENWKQVRTWDWSNWGWFFTAAVMFALFLFAARAMVWRKILSGFGHRLPVMAAARIWSTSELARYMPGGVWQVIGRVYLVKPYGVRGSICTASQVIELTIFLLANVLVAVGCLVWLGIKEFQGPARVWLWVALALVPVLAGLLHPRILYTVLNKILVRLNKPLVTRRMSFWYLFGLLAWSVAGVLFQSFAIWLLVSPQVGGSDYLPLTKWWVVAGSYALAWTAGFLAFWAPGGIAVRELVFVAAMKVALRDTDVVRHNLFDAGGLNAFLAFLSVMLRLWTIVGELMLAAVTYAADYRGALGRPDAPGRKPLPVTPVGEPPGFPLVAKNAE